MEDAFMRMRLLLGEANLAKLKKSSVAVIGLGGVGSYAAEAIARCGVGAMTLVDGDTVSITNINRQILALTSTVGFFKTDVMESRIKDINPELIVTKHTCRYNEATGDMILDSDLDYVIDAIDSIRDKIHLIKSCLTKGLPLISSMGMANRLDPLQLTIADIKQTSICPMAKKIRKELRAEGIADGVKVVYSRELPRPVTDQAETHLGSVAYIPSIAGLMMAGAVINDLCAAANQ